MSNRQRSKLPDPARYAAIGTEHAEQVALFMWASQHFDEFPELRLMFAIPNGGERNVIVASNLKAEGCKAGVPDVFLPVARGPWHGLFLELKRKKSEAKSRGYATAEQLKWIKELQAQGFGAMVCLGWEVARDCVLSYLTFQKGLTDAGQAQVVS